MVLFLSLLDLLKYCNYNLFLYIYKLYNLNSVPCHEADEKLPTSIVEYLERMSQLVMDFSEIQEIDINPLLVFEQGKGSKVVDARIVI